MNIIRQLSIKSMSRNKTTTFVTIIGIIMSLALMTGLFLFANGLIDFFRQDVAVRDGDLHIHHQLMSAAELETLSHRDMLEKEVRLPYLGAYPNDSEHFVYTVLLGIQPSDMEQSVPLRASRGRLPEAEGEAVISQSVNSFRDEPIEIGQTITLDIYQPSNYYIHETDNQYEPIPGGITLTIVGEAGNRLPYPMNGPTIFVHQTPEQVAEGELFWAGFRLKDVSDASIETFTEDWEMANWGTTSLATYYQGVSSGLSFFVKSFAMVLVVIVAIAGIGLIQNGFLISLSQRMQELSILSSVGMTRRQKWRMAVTEGGLMYLIGLPFGILSGFLAMWIVFQVLTPMMQRLFDTPAFMRLVWDWPTLLQIGVAGLVTVLIATIVPALRTSHTTPLAGVKQQEEITLTPKKLKSPGFIRKLFGMEGDLAWKNLQRNKRKYRGTLVSLIFSLVLYLSLASLMHYSDIANQVAMSQGRDDVIVYFYNTPFDQSVRDKARDIFAVDGVREGYAINKLYGTADNQGGLTAKTQELINPTEVPTDIVTFDEATLNQLLEQWGMTRAEMSGKAVLVNHYRYQAEDRSYQQEKLYQQPPTELTITFWGQNGYWEQTVPIGHVVDQPLEIYDAWYPGASLIMIPEDFEQISANGPENVIIEIRLMTEPARHVQAVEEVSELLSQITFSAAINDQRANQQSMSDLILIAKILFFGFATVIALISLANIYNSLMSSLQFRRQEFAMLRSVGMEEKSFRRMIRFESYFYALKLLIWSIPIGLGTSYLMHWYLTRVVDMAFGIPIRHFVIATVIVISILLLIMNLGSRQARKGNILDELKLHVS